MASLTLVSRRWYSTVFREQRLQRRFWTNRKIWEWEHVGRLILKQNYKSVPFSWVIQEEMCLFVHEWWSKCPIFKQSGEVTEHGRPSAKQNPFSGMFSMESNGTKPKAKVFPDWYVELELHNILQFFFKCYTVPVYRLFSLKSTQNCPKLKTHWGASKCKSPGLALTLPTFSPFPTLKKLQVILLSQYLK